MQVAPVPRLLLWALFAGFVLLYLLAMPANHIESVDRHAYAMWAESLPLSDLIDTRSILFTVLNRTLFVAAQALGAGLPATTLVTAYSVFAGAGACVLLARLLNRHFALPVLPAVTGGVLLGLSYGVWRYAMEVEVYVASIFMVLAALSFLLARLEEQPLRPLRFLLPGVVAGLVVMFYQPNVFPLFLAVPALFLGRGRLVPFVAYGAAGTLTVLLAYVAAFALSRDEPLSLAGVLGFIGSRNAEFTADPVNLASLAKALLAISHTLLSSNWIFGIDSLAEAFQSRFPATETEYKVLSAAHYQPWVRAPLLLLPALAIVAVWLLSNARRGSGNLRLVAYFLLWIAVYALVAGRLDPGIAEVWIPVLPVWVVLGTVFVLAPAAGRGRKVPVLALPLLVLLWNWFGGIGMLKNPEGDFLGRQAAVLAPLARASDMIVLTDSTWKSRTYFKHVQPAKVLTLHPGCAPGTASSAAALAQSMAEIAAQGGRVFVFETFVTSPERLAHVHDCPALRDNALALAQSLAARTRLVAGEGAFAAYEIVP